MNPRQQNSLAEDPALSYLTDEFVLDDDSDFIADFGSSEEDDPNEPFSDCSGKTSLASHQSRGVAGALSSMTRKSSDSKGALNKKLRPVRSADSSPLDRRTRLNVERSGGAVFALPAADSGKGDHPSGGGSGGVKKLVRQHVSGSQLTGLPARKPPQPQSAGAPRFVFVDMSSGGAVAAADQHTDSEVGSLVSEDGFPDDDYELDLSTSTSASAVTATATARAALPRPTMSFPPVDALTVNREVCPVPSLAPAVVPALVPAAALAKVNNKKRSKAVAEAASTGAVPGKSKGAGGRKKKRYDFDGRKAKFAVLLTHYVRMLERARGLEGGGEAGQARVEQASRLLRALFLPHQGKDEEDEEEVCLSSLVPRGCEVSVGGFSPFQLQQQATGPQEFLALRRALAAAMQRLAQRPVLWDACAVTALGPQHQEAGGRGGGGAHVVTFKFVCTSQQQQPQSWSVGDARGGNEGCSKVEVGGLTRCHFAGEGLLAAAHVRLDSFAVCATAPAPITAFGQHR